MNYNTALDYLDKLGMFGIKPGLERITRLLELLDNPQLKYKTIHITGTNGKGSVTSMVAMGLECAGVKTGKFTSPHLVKHNERMTINGVDISDEDFAKIVQSVALANEQLQEQLQDTLTQFEFLTAMAFLYFANEKVDYAVIEVGMGGKFDSTNVLNPVLTIITNVALDHTDRLGSSVVEIAHDKAGILRTNVPIITGADSEPLLVIKEYAKKLQAPILVLAEDFSAKQCSLDKVNLKQTFTFSHGKDSKNYSINLIGKHQIKNAAIATMALNILAKSILQINETTISKALGTTKWAGRIEIVKQNPLIILDGAHNVHGAKALRDALDEVFSERKLCLIFGMMKDKNISEVLSILKRPEDFCIATVADASLARSASTIEISEHIKENIIQEEDLLQAVAKAKKLVGKSGILCICGSLYLVGRAKKELLGLLT